MRILHWLIVILVTTGPALADPTHRFRIERDWLTMPDGVRLSATVFSPIPRTPGERFPTLLELLPYRKDDSFYLRDYPHYSWFASRGFRAVKVDVRGTGSSEGRLPDREYSERELDDAESLVAQLARRPGSNGRVGMWGISWGGFNAIQTAMRGPPALRAILAVDASDDLFHDDVHYIDGIMHVDMYQLEIDHENGLPASPGYPVDEAYREQRFAARPWLLRYMREQRAGPFWSRASLRGKYDKLRIPGFLIGGLHDGYRDSVPRMLENVTAPQQAWMGPWNHDFPDSGVPGPQIDWREEARRFFDRWLGNVPEGDRGLRRFRVFVRTGPGTGGFHDETWPIERTRSWLIEAHSGAERVVRLPYRPGTGRAAGDWWGESPGDMREDDATGVTFDTPPLTAPRTVIGCAAARIVARVHAPLVHWSARLEDVAPDGTVTLVTGAARNGTELTGRVDFTLPLHFTTWTFQPGHRVRLALTHAQFPMLWPTPHRTTSDVLVGSGRTGLVLPEVTMEGRRPLDLPGPLPTASRPDAKELPTLPVVERVSFTDPATGELGYRMASSTRYAIRDREHLTEGTLEHRVDPSHPERARAIGRMKTRILEPDRTLELRTRFTVRSDRRRFHVTFSRQLLENGRVRLSKTWRDAIPRDGH